MKRIKSDIIKVICVTVVLFILVLLIESAKWLRSEWSEIDFATALFQLGTPLKGTDFSIISRFIRKCLLKSIGICAVLSLMYYCVRGVSEKIKLTLSVTIRKLHFKKTTGKHFFGAVYLSAVIGFLLVYLTYQGIKVEFFDWLKNVTERTQIFEEYYVQPDSETIEFPEKKRNLILIYLESMESTYASTDVGGGKPVNYIPELAALAEENINFSDGEKLGGGHRCQGTGFTTGAILATGAGVPFKTMINDKNSMSEYTTFLPGLTTIGDILSEEGYVNYFACGSDAEFGGRGLLYRVHGDYIIHDYNYAKEIGYVPEDYLEGWGMEDKLLFSLAQKDLTELGESGEPFNYTLLTVDTHFPDGYVCSECLDTYPEPYANVISCSSRMVNEFVSWITEQEWYDNTTVVLLGDHISMQTEFWDDIGEYTRNTYNCFMNAAVSVNAESEKNRIFNSMDYFPTILASMGVQIKGDRLGLGTNLFSGTPTLLEELGEETFNGEIKKYSPYFIENFEQSN